MNIYKKIFLFLFFPLCVFTFTNCSSITTVRPLEKEKSNISISTGGLINLFGPEGAFPFVPTLYVDYNFGIAENWTIGVGSQILTLIIPNVPKFLDLKTTYLLLASHDDVFQINALGNMYIYFDINAISFIPGIGIVPSWKLGNILWYCGVKLNIAPQFFIIRFSDEQDQNILEGMFWPQPLIGVNFPLGNWIFGFEIKSIISFDFTPEEVDNFDLVLASFVTFSYKF